MSADAEKAVRIKIDRVSTRFGDADSPVSVAAAIDHVAVAAPSPEHKKNFESWLLSVLKVHVAAVAGCIKLYAEACAAGKAEEGAGMVGLHLQGMHHSMSAMAAFLEGPPEPQVEVAGSAQLDQLDKEVSGD